MATKLMMLVEQTDDKTKATVELDGGLSVSVEGKQSDSVFKLLARSPRGQRRTR
jgi:hypothetical protein